MTNIQAIAERLLAHNVHDRCLAAATLEEIAGENLKAILYRGLPRCLIDKKNSAVANILDTMQGDAMIQAIYAELMDEDVSLADLIECGVEAIKIRKEIGLTEDAISTLQKLPTTKKRAQKAKPASLPCAIVNQSIYDSIQSTMETMLDRVGTRGYAPWTNYHCRDSYEEDCNPRGMRGIWREDLPASGAGIPRLLRTGYAPWGKYAVYIFEELALDDGELIRPLQEFVTFPGDNSDVLARAYENEAPVRVTFKDQPNPAGLVEVYAL